MGPAQFIAKEIRILDYCEAVGQPLETHIHWLQSRGHDRILDVSFESVFRAAGYGVRVIPNQGKGGARLRAEAGGRLFPSIWFDEETTDGLITMIEAQFFCATASIGASQRQ